MVDTGYLYCEINTYVHILYTHIYSRTAVDESRMINNHSV